MKEPLFITLSPVDSNHSHSQEDSFVKCEITNIAPVDVKVLHSNYETILGVVTMRDNGGGEIFLVTYTIPNHES